MCYFENCVVRDLSKHRTACINLFKQNCSFPGTMGRCPRHYWWTLLGTKSRTQRKKRTFPSSTSIYQLIKEHLMTLGALNFNHPWTCCWNFRTIVPEISQPKIIFHHLIYDHIPNSLNFKKLHLLKICILPKLGIDQEIYPTRNQRPLKFPSNTLEGCTNRAWPI